MTKGQHLKSLSDAGWRLVTAHVPANSDVTIKIKKMSLIINQSIISTNQPISGEHLTWKQNRADR
jgi:hypothetical protein